VPIAGIDVVKRAETRISVDSSILSAAVLPVFYKITDMIQASLIKLPEKVYCDILDSGICLTGGGACIEGMDRLIAAKTQMSVRIAPDPLHAVINGATQTLNYWNGKKCWWNNIVWPGIPT
jgi:rod shape-determining protein MreB